jgi:murein DD-endopeptidase MepM/ murein hydrolase activator NlpD
MGQVGTPVIAVEGGVVEALGWNQYGGWRIGIRSLDKKRYYYYAHLRKNFPYRKDLTVGSVVRSGDVIGYLGRTGYSIQENVNNLNTSHLHFGMQLIFDESQKECLSEIWIDVYEIVRLLDNKRSEVRKDPETKDYFRVYDYRDTSQLTE